MSVPASPHAFTALVMAASRGPDDPVARYAGADRKCLVPAGGVPMLVRVVEALEASGIAARIFVSVDRPESFAEELPVRDLIANGRIVLLPSGASPSQSVLDALKGIEEPYPLLVTTADSPLLTSAMLRHFGRESLSSEADVTAGLAPASVILRDFPDAQRTFLRFRDDRYSGCNLFAVVRPAGLSVVRFWRKAERHRKTPWRLVRTFGISSLMRFALGRLSLDGAMRRVSAVAGAKAHAVRMPFATAAIDVDKPEDLELVERILAKA